MLNKSAGLGVIGEENAVYGRVMVLDEDDSEDGLDKKKERV